MNLLKKYYNEYIIPNLVKEYKYSNIHLVPKIEKIVVSAGLGLKAQNKLFLKKAIEEISLITGQYPKTTTSKKSIAGFKLRENILIGLVVTLRKNKMYSFLEKLIKLVLPRIRDFQGLNQLSFDKNGNYNLGISDQLIFPEIDYINVDQLRGYNISIITTTYNVQQSYTLLKEFGFPFKK
jgi:large subunit ribosomal protein L5